MTTINHALKHGGNVVLRCPKGRKYQFSDWHEGTGIVCGYELLKDGAIGPYQRLPDDLELARTLFGNIRPAVWHSVVRMFQLKSPRARALKCLDHALGQLDEAYPVLKDLEAWTALVAMCHGREMLKDAARELLSSPPLSAPADVPQDIPDSALPESQRAVG